MSENINTSLSMVVITKTLENVNKEINKLENKLDAQLKKNMSAWKRAKRITYDVN